MYLLAILTASFILMWVIHKKIDEDDDDGPIWR
jgi:hypothetical protein